MAELLWLPLVTTLASGAALVLLALVMLSGGPARPWGSLPFGLFTLAWAAHLISSGFAHHLEAYAGPLFIVSLGMLLVMPYLLIEFACSYTGKRDRRLWFPAVRWGSASLALMGWVWLAAKPSAFLLGTVEMDGVYHASWSILKVGIADIPLLLAFAAALLILQGALQSFPTPRTRNRVVVLLIGLGLYVAYSTGSNLVDLLTTGPNAMDSPELILLVFLALAGVILALGSRAFWAVRNARTPDERWRNLLLGFSLLFPLLWGLMEQVLVALVVAGLDGSGQGTSPTMSLWRIASIGTVAYGLARWRIHDLPQRLQSAAASSTGASCALGFGAIIFGLGTGFTDALLLPSFGAILAAGVVIVPSIHAAQRWLGPALTEPPQDQVHERGRP